MSVVSCVRVSPTFTFPPFIVISSTVKSITSSDQSNVYVISFAFVTPFSLSEGIILTIGVDVSAYLSVCNLKSVVDIFVAFPAISLIVTSEAPSITNSPLSLSCIVYSYNTSANFPSSVFTIVLGFTFLNSPVPNLFLRLANYLL